MTPGARCARCDVPLRPVSTEPRRRRSDWTVQYWDALPISFEGGYGMYADPDDLIPVSFGEGNGYRNHTAILCKSCADALLAANPWMRLFVDERLAEAEAS